MAIQAESAAANFLYNNSNNLKCHLHYDTTSRCKIDGEWPAIIFNFSGKKRFSLRPLFFAYEDRKQIVKLLVETFRRLAVLVILSMQIKLSNAKLTETGMFFRTETCNLQRDCSQVWWIIVVLVVYIWVTFVKSVKHLEIVKGRDYVDFGLFSAILGPIWPNSPLKLPLKTPRPVNNHGYLPYMCVWSHSYPLGMNKDRLSDREQDFGNFVLFLAILGQNLVYFSSKKAQKDLRPVYNRTPMSILGIYSNIYLYKGGRG